MNVRLYRLVLIAVCAVSVTGCGSGGSGPLGDGGGGGGGSAPLFNCTGATEFDWSVTVGSTTYCSYGPGTVKADAAYAKGATGAGVVVAVIDTGIDTTHTELDANISASSVDIVRGDPMTDEDGHGTHVAGIIAAEQNGFYNHGIAYDATIMAIRADTRVVDETICGSPTDPCSIFFDPDLVNAVNYAASNSAQVINMSLGGNGAFSAAFETALIDAMAAGAIVVAATGNDGAAQPGYPAYCAADPVVNASGQLIAVGAVDETGQIASFSNYCGDAAAFCLVAPGVNILSTYSGGTFAVASGTSQAAPLVSGAAALLISAWPSLTPAEVVDILLTSATDLGGPGLDAVYGHGLLNLDAAVAPLGSLTIPLGDSASGQSVSLDGTVLSLGSAFGDALDNSLLLQNAFALDDYDRDYIVALDSRVQHTDRGFGLLALMSDSEVKRSETTLADGLTVAMGYADPGSADHAADWAGMAADEASRDPYLHGLKLNWEQSNGASIGLGYRITPESQLGGMAADDAAGLFWMPGDLLQPHHALVGAGNGVSASRAMDGDIVVTAGLVEESRGETGTAQGNARIGEISMLRRFAGGAELRASYSLVGEEDGFLGSDSSGGFAVKGTESRFMTLGGRTPLGAGLELVGNYTLGTAEIAADGTSLLSGWSGARADSLGVGLVRRGVFGSADRLGFLAGQPLRVTEVSATLTAPTGYDADKTVTQESERVSLAPSGREVDLQLAYERPLGGSAGISGWLMMQLEPGHVADADPAYGVGLRFGMEF